jgi:hypothetical protein
MIDPGIQQQPGTSSKRSIEGSYHSAFLGHSVIPIADEEAQLTQQARHGCCARGLV